MQRKVAAGSNKATNPPPPPLLLCDHCQQPAQPGKHLLVCSSCHEACYCSPEHEVAAWGSHKILCKQRKKEKKEKEKEKERKESEAAINYLLLTNPPVAARPPESLSNACMDREVGQGFEYRYYPSIYGLPEWPHNRVLVAAHQPRRPAGQGFEYRCYPSIYCLPDWPHRVPVAARQSRRRLLEVNR